MCLLPPQLYQDIKGSEVGDQEVWRMLLVYQEAHPLSQSSKLGAVSPIPANQNRRPANQIRKTT